MFFPSFHKYKFHCDSKKALGSEIKGMLPLQKKNVKGCGCLGRPIIEKIPVNWGKNFKVKKTVL